MILCLVAAATFWLLNAMNGNHSADVHYPVIFRYNNQELTNNTGNEQKIHFHAYGQGWDLLKMKMNWFLEPIEVNISNKKKFRYVLTPELKPYLEDKLPAIEIRYFLNDTLYTGLDKVKKVKMKVYLDREGLKLKEDYKIAGTILIRPEYIMATGPSSILDTLSHKILIRVGDENILDEYKEKIKLPTPENSLVHYDTDVVEVSFAVTKHKRPFTE